MIIRSFNPDWKTCRLCGKWESDEHTGPMYKYAIRHHAHARCGIMRWGREWLDKQPTWIIEQFPWLLAVELKIEDYIRDRMDPMRQIQRWRAE